ncbi:hypothetical protein [Fodinibius saliphilus]|uniref:hypothetical protein n=1 Tax=Fodinibius saliphilus TaxID=1920650 RepID=UPI00110800B5|nr:hypothetical protein [Fodinibius saliphilus]
MRLESVDSTKYRVTLHTYELAALISAARWVVNDAGGEIPNEAREQLSRIVNSYDAESKRINKTKN